MAYSKDACEKIAGALVSCIDQDAIKPLEAVALEQLKECLLFLLVTSDAHLQVDAGEVGLSNYVLWVLDVEQIANRHLRALGSCGCETQDDRVLGERLLASCLLSGVESQLLPNHVVDLEVGRPEVVRPFTRAVNLVHANHGDLSVEAREVLDEEALRGDEQHLDALLRHGLDHLALHLIGLLRVQSGAWDVGGQLLKLVRHQRDQRGDHKDQARHEHRHVLVDKRFSAASCEDNQSVLFLLKEDLKSLKLSFLE